jgi:hypothetical protein
LAAKILSIRNFNKIKRCVAPPFVRFSKGGGLDSAAIVRANAPTALGYGVGFFAGAGAGAGLAGFGAAGAADDEDFTG